MTKQEEHPVSFDDLDAIDADITSPPEEEGLAPLAPLPQDLSSAQLTLRAVLTGMLLGGALSLCNIYAGLKVGWGFNMSSIAVLASMAFWQPLSSWMGWRGWGMLENNTSQTTASSGAAISSAGLVTAIPALTILTGQVLSWWQLTLWTCSVCLVGVFVGAALRRQMLLRDPLPFPAGTANAILLKDLYGGAREAKLRIRALLLSGAAAGLWLLIHTFVLPIKKLYLRITLPFLGKLKEVGVMALNTAHLGWGIEPSALLIGTGILVGVRISVSLYVGATVAWGILGPIALHQGWASPGALATTHSSWYKVLVKWLLWPGVAIMVLASLTSLAISWWDLWRKSKEEAADTTDTNLPEEHPSTLAPSYMFLLGMGAALIFSVWCQATFFGIPVIMGVFSVLIAFLLAAVAARVSGTTGITPKGALGKVSQLSFGLWAQGQVIPNLMAANVTAGAAAHSADILHDLKTGHLLGASPRAQLVGQLCGVISGAIVGSAAYLWLVPDPKTMLLTPEWPAPAVAVWKSVAELLGKGLQSMPQSALWACLIGAIVGIIAAILEKKGPERLRPWIPAPSAFGVAFVLPATASVTIFVGGALLWLASRIASSWTERYAIAIAAGLIAGESLFGIFTSMLKILIH